DSTAPHLGSVGGAQEQHILRRRAAVGHRPDLSEHHRPLFGHCAATRPRAGRARTVPVQHTRAPSRFRRMWDLTRRSPHSVVRSGTGTPETYYGVTHTPLLRKARNLLVNVLTHLVHRRFCEPEGTRTTHVRLGDVRSRRSAHGTPDLGPPCSFRVDRQSGPPDGSEARTVVHRTEG